MESERQLNKGGIDGMEGGEREVKVMNTRRSVGCSELVLRIVALALTLVAAVVVGVDKQTQVVPIIVAEGLPPLNVPVSAKWHYMSAFVYFVVSNAIACSYAAFSLIGLFANRRGNGMGLVILIMDMVMVALLFSSNGAAAAIGVIGYKGNSHVQWNKVCNVFDKFCHHVAAGLVLSLIGSLAFLVLAVLAALKSK